MAKSSASPASVLSHLKLTPPANIALVAYVIMGIVLLFPFEYPVYDEHTGTTFIVKYDIGERLLMVILMTIPVVLSVYTINCLILGNCVTWSYVLSLVTVFWVAVFVLLAFIYTFSKKA